MLSRKKAKEAKRIKASPSFLALEKDITELIFSLEIVQQKNPAGIKANIDAIALTIFERAKEF